MAIFLRQICLVANSLEPAVSAFSDIFSMPVCHRDPEVGKFGLENALLLAGSQFIEVVAPTRENTAAGRFLQRRGGDGGYMVICQVATKEEQASIRERALQNNVRIAYESDRTSWNIMQLHPADMGAAFFEVDWDQQADMTGNWQPAGGKDWQTMSASAISHIVAIELQSEDPDTLSTHWGTIANAPVLQRDGWPTVLLANVILRFVTVKDGRGAGLSGLDFHTTHPDHILTAAKLHDLTICENQIDLCGIRINLVN